MPTDTYTIHIPAGEDVDAAISAAVRAAQQLRRHTELLDATGAVVLRVTPEGATTWLGPAPEGDDEP